MSNPVEPIQNTGGEDGGFVTPYKSVKRTPAKPLTSVQSKRVMPITKETAAGNYLVEISLTFSEVSALNRMLQKAVPNLRRKAKVTHEEKLHKDVEHLSDVESYVLYAHSLLKTATNARRQGRWLSQRLAETGATDE